MEMLFVGVAAEQKYWGNLVSTDGTTGGSTVTLLYTGSIFPSLPA